MILKQRMEVKKSIPGAAIIESQHPLEGAV